MRNPTAKLFRLERWGSLAVANLSFWIWCQTILDWLPAEDNQRLHRNSKIFACSTSAFADSRIGTGTGFGPLAEFTDIPKCKSSLVPIFFFLHKQIRKKKTTQIEGDQGSIYEHLRP